MPIYDLQLKDGRTISVEAPMGASMDDLVSAANQQLVSPESTALGREARIAARRAKRQEAQDELDRLLEEQRSRAAGDKEEPGLTENILSGFGSGVVGLGELAALGGATLLDEEAELQARDRILSLAESIGPEGGDPESLAYKLSAGLGSIAGIAGAGAAAAGAAAASPLAALAGAIGLGTAGAIGVGAGAGEASERARADGATEEERRTAALKGAAIGATEILPIGRIARALRIPGLTTAIDKLGGKIDAETVVGRLGQRLRSAGATGVAEGAQEAAAAILQNLTEQGYNPEKELVDAGIIDEGVIGGGAGAILQALTDFLPGRRVRAPSTPEEELLQLTGPDREALPAPEARPRLEAPPGTQREMFTQEEMGAPPEGRELPPLEGEIDLTDPRLERAQGALQFAPDAPAGRRFTDEEVPASPAMPEAMAPIARKLEFERAEAERAAKLEAEKEADLTRIEVEALRQEQERVLTEAERERREEERPRVELAGRRVDEPRLAPIPVRPFKEVLDELGVPPRTKVREMYEGSTTDNAGALQALRDYAKRTPYSDIRAKVREFLAAQEREVIQPEPEAPVEVPRGERPADRPETPAPENELEAIRAGVAGGKRELGLGRGTGEGVPSPGRGGPTAPATQPAGAGLGVSVPSARAPTVGAGAQPTTLEGQGELFPGADLGAAPARPTEPEAGIEEGPSPQQQFFDTAGQPIVPPAAPEPAAEVAPEPTPEAPEAEAGPTNVPRWKQVLGEPPEWAKLVATKYPGDVVYISGNIGLHRAYNAYNGTYNYLPIKDTGERVRFGTVDVTEFTEDLLTDAEKQQLIDARNEIEFQEDLKESQNPNGPFAEGEQFAFSTNFPQDLAQIATQWAQLLGIKDRIFFFTKEDARSLEELEKHNLYGTFGGPVRSLGIAEKLNGETRPLADGSHALFLKIRRNKTATLEVLAHEMGHVLEEEAFKSAPEETRQAIMGEYKQWLDTKDEKNAATWVRELRAHVSGRLTVRKNPESQTDKASELPPYWTSFSEYFADQVSKWAVSSERPVTVVEQFFARLAAALRRMYASLAGKASLPNAEMKKYLDSRMPSESPLTAVGLPLAPPEDTAKTETVKKAPTAPVSAKPKAPAAKPAPKKAAPKPAPKKAAPKAKTEGDSKAYARIKKAKADGLPLAEQALKRYTANNESMETVVEAAANDAVAQEKSIPNGDKLSLLVMQWVRQNGSAELNAKLDAEIARTVKMIRGDQTTTQRTATKRLVDALKKAGELDMVRLMELAKDVRIARDGKILPLESKAVVGLDLPLAPDAMGALLDGNLTGALEAVGKAHPIQQFRNLANKLAGRLGNTKLQLVANLKDAAGNPVAGLFDPKTNTIKLDRDTGLNTHTLMHETAHAVTSANLAKKGHPTTQALNKLFNDIKDSLDTAYGAQSLDEFVAEAFSNPEFQYKLQTINLKGDPVNAWTRFVGAVANFLRSLVGLDTKPATAQDQFFNLVDNILAPSPETRDAGALYMASQSGEGGKFLSAAYENAPTWGKQAVESLGDFLSRVDVAEKAKRFILDLTPLNNFADLVKDSLPEAKQLDDIVYKQSAMLAKMLEKTEPTVAKVAKWFKEQGKQTITVDGIQMDKGTALNDAAHVGSYEGVNPTYDESRYKDTDKLEAYRYVKRRYDKLGPEGQAAYRSLLNTYKFFKDQIGESLEIALKDATPDSKSRTALIKDLYDRLINEGGIDPYVAFDREGKFWLEYNAIDPRTKQSEYFVEAFDTKAARERAVKELEAKKGEIGLTGLNRFTNIAETDYNKAPPGSFVREILDILEANGVSEETKESVMRTFLEYLPEKSMAQAFQFRKGPGGKGVRGMRGDITPLSVNMPRHDVIDVLQKRVPALARQISQLRYNREIQNLVSEAEKRVRAKGRPDADVRNLEQLQGRAEFVQNPNIPNWSKRITSTIFAWTLGANPSSALLQFSQIGLVVAPMLAARPGVGIGKTTSALGNAVRAFMASGTSRKVEMVGPDGDVVERTRAMPSIDNFDFAGPKPEHMSEEYWKKLRVLARVGADHNVLGRSIIQDMVDIEDSRGLAAKLNTGMAFMFHNAEKMNKQVALMMAYEVELAGNKSPSEAQMERAALNAIEFVEIANGSAAQAGAAPIAQDKIGRIAYMYKRYGVSMVYLQLKMMRDAFKGQDPEVRNLAKRQLVATWGAAGLLSGAMGLPFYGVISMVYDAFREDDEDDFDTVMQKATPPLIARGALNYLTGVDVASRVQMTDLLFREPIIENESFLWEMVMTFGGPAVGLANNFERGVEQILEGNTERGIEAMAPAAMRNVLRAGRYYMEGAETLRGDPILDDVGFGHAALQGLGFAPAEYIRQMEINQNAKRIDRNISEKRTKLMRQYYIALRQGDSEGASDVLDEIEKFNRRNADYAITVDSLKRSLKSHIRTSQRMHYGVTYSPKLQQRMLDSMDDYEGAVSIWD